MAKTDWKWHKITTDGKVTVYDCSYIDEDETFKKRGITVRDIPHEGRQALADLTRLDAAEFEDWINFINYSPDSERVGVNIENVWLNSYKADWNWKKSDAHTNETQVAHQCPGWKCSKEILTKIRSRQITVEDIPEEARRTLADLHKLDLTESKNWCNLQYATAEPTGIEVCIYIHRVWINHNEPKWDWKKDSKSDNEDLGIFYCPGWKCTQEILDKIKNNKIKFEDIPKDAQEKLAKKVALSENDIKHWVNKIEVKADLKEIEVKAYAPNVWICADILRGGNSWNQFIGFGTWLGKIPSRFLRDKKVVYCETIAEFFKELQRGKGKIWGMVLFAHGNSYGSITSGDPNDPDAPNQQTQNPGRNQMEIMKILAQYKYKLSKIFMMQCFSGYRGKLSWNFQYSQSNQAKAIIEEYLRRLYGDSIDNVDIKISTNRRGQQIYVATFDINWKEEWDHYGIDVIPYGRWNIVLIDTGWINWGNWIEKAGITWL